MKQYAIVEIEDNVVAAVVAGRAGNTLRVLRSGRAELREPGAGVEAALRELGPVLAGCHEVRVVIGDRRARHYSNTVPRLADGAAAALVMREGVRLANAGQEADVLVASEISRRLPGGRFVLSSTALVAEAWTVVGAAFRAVGLEVVGLHTPELCLAKAAAGEPAAVLEVVGGRARFVLSDGSAPVLARRFLIGAGADAPGEAIAMQLMMELPRTFDWLRENGHAVPERLVLGGGVPREAMSVEMLQADGVREVVDCGYDVEPCDASAAPSLAVLAVLDRVSRGAPLPSLLAGVELRLPWSAVRLATVAAGLLLGAAASWHGARAGAEWWRAREQVEVTAERAEHVERVLREQRVAMLSTAAPTAADARLEHVLSHRRPVSRMLADVCNATDLGVCLEELTFSSDEPFTVAGFVEADSRTAALEALARFSRRVRALTYLEPLGDEQVGRIAAPRPRFRFRLRMSWRNT